MTWLEPDWAWVCGAGGVEWRLGIIPSVTKECETQRLRENTKFCAFVLWNVLIFSPPSWPSCRREALWERVSIHFAVSAPGAKWRWEETSSPGWAPRGTAWPLMESSEGSRAFLQHKTQLSLSAPSPHTAVPASPLPFPPLCPRGAQPTFNSKAMRVLFLLLTPSAFQQQRRPRSGIASCRLLPDLVKLLPAWGWFAGNVNKRKREL